MTESDIYFSIDRTPEGGIQLSINDGHGGYRICGPKYDGRSKTIGRHKLTERDVKELRSYLSKVSPGVMAHQETHLKLLELRDRAARQPVSYKPLFDQAVNIAADLLSELCQIDGSPKTSG